MKNIYNFTYCGIEDAWIRPVILSFSAFGYAVPLVLIGAIYVTIVRFTRSTSRSIIRESSETSHRGGSRKN